MKITFDCPDKINGQLTMTIEPADYQEQVEKTLKNYRKKAQVPGFRPGMVPMGMIKKQYGTAVKVEEINKLMGEKLYGYIQENKIEMLGEPLPSEKQVPQDFEKEGDLTFVFDIAVAPEFKVELTNKDKIDYYQIKVEDKLIDDQVQMYASQAVADDVGQYGGQLIPGFQRGFLVALLFALGNLEDVVGLWRLVDGDASFASVNTAHGTDADTVLRDGARVEAIRRAPDLAASRIVAVEQHLINDNTAAEACAEGYAEEILVAFRVALLLQDAVYLGQQSAKGLAVDEEVAVVVDKDGHVELVLKDLFQRHTPRKVGRLGRSPMMPLG